MSFLPKFLKKCLSKVVKIVRSVFNLAIIIMYLPLVLLGFVIASGWHDASVDPQVITNNLTPVLLIHGSDSNQQQWLLFRQFLKDDNVGHNFAFNMNTLARRNDDNKDVLEYATCVKRKLEKMKVQYAKSGFNMDSVILVGNSMGGLVAAAYCVSQETLDVSVRAVITISTPWEGSIFADWFCNETKSPERYFRRHSKERQSLKERFLWYATTSHVPVYTYGSHWDFLVTPKSSLLSPNVNEALIDDRNDHLTTMTDWRLACYVRRNWLVPNTSSLSEL